MLLISADLDELIGLSDTLQVILRGRLVGRADPATVTPERARARDDRRGRGGPRGATGSANRRGTALRHLVGRVIARLRGCCVAAPVGAWSSSAHRAGGPVAGHDPAACSSR